MNPMDPSRHVPSPSDPLKQGQLQDVSTSTAASGPDGSSSELGRVAQDVGAAITKWKENLNQALKDWLADANDIEELVKVLTDAVPFLSELKKDVYSDPLNLIALNQIIMKKIFGQDPSSVPIYLSQDDYNQMVNVMTELGIPSSEIPGSSEPISYDGTTYVTIPLGDFQSSVEMIKDDVGQALSEISSKKNKETKDMFHVMFCFNAEKMNEESLTSALQSLTSLSQSLMQNMS